MEVLPSQIKKALKVLWGIIVVMCWEAVIEGNFFSAIHLWRLIAWVEEVQDILRQLKDTFRYVSREANIVAGDLAKKRVIPSSINFDV